MSENKGRLKSKTWSQDGNNTSSTDVLGTLNNQPLKLITNGTLKAQILPNGNVGIGTQDGIAGQKLHIGDGNILVEGGGETAQIFKRGATFESPTHPSAPFVNPIFQIGRIIQGGDGAPQFRWMYSDDVHAEVVVFELDSEGILSSVRKSGNRGSHFEAHSSGDAHPYFRLNSYPYMQLQMGAGGSNDTDISIGRSGEKTISFKAGAEEPFTINEHRVDVNKALYINVDAPIGSNGISLSVDNDGKIIAVEGGGDNLANSDQTFTSDRTHDLAGYILKFINGLTSFAKVQLQKLTTSPVDATTLWSDGANVQFKPETGLSRKLQYADATGFINTASTFTPTERTNYYSIFNVNNTPNNHHIIGVTPVVKKGEETVIDVYGTNLSLSGTVSAYIDIGGGIVEYAIARSNVNSNFCQFVVNVPTSVPDGVYNFVILQGGVPNSGIATIKVVSSYTMITPSSWTVTTINGNPTTLTYGNTGALYVSNDSAIIPYAESNTLISCIKSNNFLPNNQDWQVVLDIDNYTLQNIVNSTLEGIGVTDILNPAIVNPLYGVGNNSIYGNRVFGYLNIMQNGANTGFQAGACKAVITKIGNIMTTEMQVGTSSYQRRVDTITSTNNFAIIGAKRNTSVLTQLSSTFTVRLFN